MSAYVDNAQKRHPRRAATSPPAPIGKIVGSARIEQHLEGLKGAVKP